MTQAIQALATTHERQKSTAEKRAIAVAAALTVIHAKAASTPSDCNIISDEMANLSNYADLIIAALEVK